jgi:hypothetical protein
MSLTADTADELQSWRTENEFARHRSEAAQAAVDRARARAITSAEAHEILARPVTTYAGLRAALAARRRLLGWSQQEVDHRAGLQLAYTGKLEIGTKKAGDMSFECWLGALGVELYVVPKVEKQEEK